ncbi:MAG: FAD-binding protein [Actinobacteria bacterium]|nr:FAD-binding protein [Actinomycetota bacterium]
MTHPTPETYDVVVVGAGTGMLAAIAAADRGLRTLLVEKSEFLGGSTAMSGGGFWIPNNSVLRENGVRDSRERVGTYLEELLGDTVPRARWESFLDHGPKAVDVLRRYTPATYMPMWNYPDYFPEVDGGSPAGRAVEPHPFDASVLGEDLELLRPSGMAAPVPMPITGADYRSINLITRTPKGLLTAAKRVGQGIGGKALKRHYMAGGQALGAALIAGLRTAGVDVWTRTPLTDLVAEEGRVTGVVVERAGAPVTVSATKGVILASGGFDHNLEMRRRYQSEALEEWSIGNPANTGEVLQTAERAGADLTLMDQAWWFPSMAPLPGAEPLTMLAERSLPHSMIVDGSGRRFFNEAVNYMSAGQAILGQDDGEAPHLPMWFIMDQTFRNRYMLAIQAFPGMRLPQAWYDAGVAFKADTIRELAQQIGTPGLEQEVERFNLFAAQGHDDDFQRGQSMYDHYYGDPTVFPNPNLGPVEKAPFYAVKMVPGDLGTCGGVRADEFARALRPDGSVIDGLYATGNAAGNAFGMYYPGPGATVGQGLAFGWIAAAHAAGAL